MMQSKEYILNRLLKHDGFLSVEDLMRETDCSRRSIFRYIKDLNVRLERHALRIENTYGHGFKLIGHYKDKAALLAMDKKPAMDFSSFTPAQRHVAELTLLCINHEEVKASTVASILNVSDSCVNTDFEAIKQAIAEEPALQKLTLNQTKYGRYITGTLWARRMAALHSSMKVYPVEDIGRELFAQEESEHLIKLKTVLSVPVKHMQVLSCVQMAERLMGCTFTLYDSVLLYLYICYVLAIPEKEVIHTAAVCPIAPVVPVDIATTILKEIGIKSATESFMLQCVLSSLEPIKLSDTPFLDEKVGYFLTIIEKNMLQSGCIDAPLPPDLRQTLLVQLNSILFKKACYIPLSVKDYSNLVPELQIGSCIYKTLTPLVQDYCNVTLDKQDVEPLRVSIRSAAKQYTSLVSGKRALVLCYEGLCVSRLVAAELRIFFPELEIVNIVGIINVTEEYLKKNNVDIVISSVPIPQELLGTVPCYAIPSPFNRTSLVQGFKQFIEEHVADFSLQSDKTYTWKTLHNPTERAIHRLFSKFMITELAKPIRQGKITEKLAEIIIPSDKGARKALKTAFDLRERKGHVYLQIENIQLFHCRCDCVDDATAGLVRCGDNHSVIVYLVAPIQAKKEELMALSLISSALIESDEFAKKLHDGTCRDLEDILLNLVSDE